MQWSSDYDWDELPGPSQNSDIPKLIQSKKKKRKCSPTKMVMALPFSVAGGVKKEMKMVWE